MTPFLKPSFHGSILEVGIHKAITRLCPEQRGLAPSSSSSSSQSCSRTSLPLFLSTPCSLLISSCACSTAWNALSKVLGRLAPFQLLGLSSSCIVPLHTPHIAAGHNALPEDICDVSVQTLAVCGRVSVLIYLVFSPCWDGEGRDLDGSTVSSSTFTRTKEMSPGTR